MFTKLARSLALVPALALVISSLVAAPVSAAPAPSPTLSVSFPNGTLYGTPYVVWGCGYGSTGVTVVVHSPVAISFAGQMPDANGCISLSNFSTQGAGYYDVDAWQVVHGSKSSIVASAGFTLN
jgi:hypothetical protein